MGFSWYKIQIWKYIDVHCIWCCSRRHSTGSQTKTLFKNMHHQNLGIKKKNKKKTHHHQLSLSFLKLSHIYTNQRIERKSTQCGISRAHVPDCFLARSSNFLHTASNVICAHADTRDTRYRQCAPTPTLTLTSATHHMPHWEKEKHSLCECEFFWYIFFLNFWLIFFFFLLPCGSSTLSFSIWWVIFYSTRWWAFVLNKCEIQYIMQPRLYLCSC